MPARAAGVALVETDRHSIPRRDYDEWGIFLAGVGLHETQRLALRLFLDDRQMTEALLT